MPRPVGEVLLSGFCKPLIARWRGSWLNARTRQIREPSRTGCGEGQTIRYLTGHLLRYLLMLDRTTNSDQHPAVFDPQK